MANTCEDRGPVSAQSRPLIWVRTRSGLAGEQPSQQAFRLLAHKPPASRFQSLDQQRPAILMAREGECCGLCWGAGPQPRRPLQRPPRSPRCHGAPSAHLRPAGTRGNHHSCACVGARAIRLSVCTAPWESRGSSCCPAWSWEQGLSRADFRPRHRPGYFRHRLSPNLTSKSHTFTLSLPWHIKMAIVKLGRHCRPRSRPCFLVQT